MLDTIGLQRFANDRIRDMQREAARLASVRRARAAAASAPVGKTVATTTCCSAAPSCC